MGGCACGGMHVGGLRGGGAGGEVGCMLRVRFSFKLLHHLQTTLLLLLVFECVL